MIPFTIRHLAALSYWQGFTLWHYRHISHVADVLEPRFFDDAADMLARGDRIMVSGTDGAVDLHVASVEHGVTVMQMGRTVS